METLFTMMHFIDLENENLTYREISSESDARDYIEQLMREIIDNESKRKYDIKRETTEVITQVLKTYRDKILDERDRDIIATKLLDEEIKAQERVERLGVKIKKGSLIQSLLRYNGKYFYLISKIESEAFLDEVDLNRKIGLRYEDKAFKNCLIEFEEDGIKEIFISDTNSGGTQYWHGEFLELEEKVTNSYNTSSTFSIIEKVIQTEFKHKKSDLIIYRNQLLGYFKNEENYDFEQCMRHIFGSSTEINIEVEKVKEKVADKISRNELDNQFTIERDAINKRKWKDVKQVNEYMLLTLNGHDEHIKENVKSVEENGEKFIKVRVTEEDTYEMFQWDE